VIALKAGSDASEDELREFVRADVAAYKYPRRIFFVDELPKTATGRFSSARSSYPWK
jgi:long-chain acyl-CoA synthetase